MKNDYKRLYENANYMLVKYQDEIVPGLRASLEAMEAQIAELNESLDEGAKECARLKWQLASVKKRYRPVTYGRLVEKEDEWGRAYYSCTACGEDLVPQNKQPNFCPLCGAILRKDGE